MPLLHVKAVAGSFSLSLSLSLKIISLPRKSSLQRCYLREGTWSCLIGSLVQGGSEQRRECEGTRGEERREEGAKGSALDPL